MSTSHGWGAEGEGEANSLLSRTPNRAHTKKAQNSFLGFFGLMGTLFCLLSSALVGACVTFCIISKPVPNSVTANDCPEQSPSKVRPLLYGVYVQCTERQRQRNRERIILENLVTRVVREKRKEIY